MYQYKVYHSRLLLKRLAVAVLSYKSWFWCKNLTNYIVQSHSCLLNHTHSHMHEKKTNC